MSAFRSPSISAFVGMMGLLVGTFVACDFSRLHAQDFRIEEVKLVDGAPEVRVVPSQEFYFILRRGDSPSRIDTATDIVLGTNPTGLLHDTETRLENRFYRVQRVPVALPTDSDGDGIDDVWELRFRSPGAALNGTDAMLDENKNGIPDLNEVQSTVASFATGVSTVSAESNTASVDLTFSRPFTGTIFYAVGGTGVPGLDYEMPSGELAVSGTSASLRIALHPTFVIEPERRLVVTLARPAGILPAYTLGSNQVHELRIVEGDQGVYLGALTVTNGFLLGPQALRVALRSNGGSAKVYFDTTRSTFFKAPFELPARIGAGSGLDAILGEATGTNRASGLARDVAWSLRFGPVTNDGNNSLTAAFTLELSGLTSSGKLLTAQGLLQATRADY